MRQLISDTATLMFLQRGFDEVKISEIAAACDVSEKTIYNYFPTKESLMLDREESSAASIRKALGPNAETPLPPKRSYEFSPRRRTSSSPISDEISGIGFNVILRFNDLIEGTPSLRAARGDMISRLAQIAAQSLAERAGVDPNDPEPQIAADALLGLWRIYYGAILKYSEHDLTPEGVRDAVMNDVRRAARLIDTGLWSFATVVQGDSGRQQFKAASEASIEARRQVLNAVKEARDAWLAIKSDMEARGRDGRDAARHTHHQVHRDAQEIRRETQEIKRLAKRQGEELKQAMKQVRKSGFKKP